jgi:hypothetical protein
MVKTDHLMAEKNKTNNVSQKGQATPKKNKKKIIIMLDIAKYCLSMRHSLTGVETVCLYLTSSYRLYTCFLQTYQHVLGYS